MTSNFQNHAAYLAAAKVAPLKVTPAPYTRPRKDEIVVRNHAVAINPVDHIIQSSGEMAFGHIKPPFILGCDGAGEVVEVGEGVTRFKAGDRVVAASLANDKRRNSSAEGTFQLYTVYLDIMTSPIPTSMSYEQACVIGLGLLTAASSLYEKGFLEMALPSLKPEKKDESLVVWGASTSVGLNAIQLAVASGYDVIATASPRNFDLCKRLGAVHVFDYSSPSAVKEITALLDGKTVAGAIAISGTGIDSCLDILSKCKGKRFIARVAFPLPQPMPTGRFAVLQIGAHIVPWMIRHSIRSLIHGVSGKFVWGTDIAFSPAGRDIFENFLPQALEQGNFVPSPGPMVVGKGLDKIQEAFEILKNGVSAKKVVVQL